MKKKKGRTLLELLPWMDVLTNQELEFLVAHYLHQSLLPNTCTFSIFKLLSFNGNI